VSIIKGMLKLALIMVLGWNAGVAQAQVSCTEQYKKLLEKAKERKAQQASSTPSGQQMENQVYMRMQGQANFLQSGKDSMGTGAVGISFKDLFPPREKRMRPITKVLKFLEEVQDFVRAHEAHADAKPSSAVLHFFNVYKRKTGESSIEPIHFAMMVQKLDQTGALCDHGKLVKLNQLDDFYTRDKE